MRSTTSGVSSQESDEQQRKLDKTALGEESQR